MAHPQDVAVPVPFSSKLVSPVEPGQTLYVHGTANEGAQRFEINLLCGTHELNEHLGSAALHISVRFDEGKIVLNSWEGAEWGKEQRVSNPFAAGETFDIRIRVHDDRYELIANQKEIAEFKHRILLQNVDHFQVKGDVTLKGVHWGGKYFQLPLEVPFHNGHLGNGGRIYIYGIPQGDRFEVNFLGANGDILFYFNPRLGEKHVVRNSCIAGQWGNEEREGPFPFKKEIGFDLVIVNEPYSIQVFVDQQRIGTFAHRTNSPQSDYVSLRIDGKVELTGLELGH
jgi:hypothetical protein